MTNAGYSRNRWPQVPPNADLDAYLSTIIQAQTEQRRADYRNGRVVRIVPEAGQARKIRRGEYPVLPELPDEVKAA